jgi:hypothetical protein
MNINRLLGKLSIGRAGTSSVGTGKNVRVGSPEDAYRSGAMEYLRTAQTEENTAPSASKNRMLHPVMLVSRFKYPYVKTKSVPGEDGEKPSKVETGNIGWKYTSNRELAEEMASSLYAYKLYVYEDAKTGTDVIHGTMLNGAQALQPGNNVEDSLAGSAGQVDSEDSDFSVDREVDVQNRLRVKGEIVKFTTDAAGNGTQADKYNAEVVPASSLGYRAYEVMPSPVSADLYSEPEDPTKIPTWTKMIVAPTEESPSAYGTSFRYRYSNGQPIPALNGIKHVLSELLSIDGEKAPKDPGFDSNFNIYEFMTENDLWDSMDKYGNLPNEVKAQIEDAEVDIQSTPELEHFTLGGGSLVNLGGKSNGIMSEENLLARALHHLGNPELFNYINNNGTEAFRPVNADEQNTSLLTRIESQLHAARQAYYNLYQSLGPKERKESPELESLKNQANQTGIKFVDLMATKYPSKLRQFVLKQPYVGHAPSGDTQKPGGKHESAYSVSSDEHLTDKGKTIATYESGGGLQKLNDDDRKLYALRKAFERNAENALNNNAKTLHNQKHSKLVDVNDSEKKYQIPTPRDTGGDWSDESQNAINFVENHWLKDHFLSQEDKNNISQLQKRLQEQGKSYEWPQVAVAYLKQDGKLKVKRYTQGVYLLTSVNFNISGPFSFEIPKDNDEAEFVSLKKYEPISDQAVDLRKQVLAQHLFSASDIEIAENLSSKEPFEDEDDVLFSIWANWLLGIKRKEATAKAEKALDNANLKQKNREESAKGKPNGWPYALTSQHFDDEEREEFSGNLEQFVNDLKNKSGAIIEPTRKVAYIKSDGTQIKLPDSVPVELPKGANMPLSVNKLKSLKDAELAKYNIARIGKSLYYTGNSNPIQADENGILSFENGAVSVQELNNMTKSNILSEYKLFKDNSGEYRYVNESDKIAPATEIILVPAQGGEKVALPAWQLDQSELGKELIKIYAEHTTGEKLDGGSIHVFPSDNDKIAKIAENLVNEGYSEQSARTNARKMFMRDKMNSVAVQCMSQGSEIDTDYTHAAQTWIPNVIDEIIKNGNPEIIENIEDIYGGIDGLKQSAMNGSLDVEDAKTIIDSYTLMTGSSPQQEAYVKPILQSALMGGYDSETTSGLPNNKFWHMIASNAPSRLKRKFDNLDSEVGNDLTAQAISHLMKKPERKLEGEHLLSLLPKQSLDVLKKTLSDQDVKIQRINSKYKTGGQTAVAVWEAKPLPHLLAEHPEWLRPEAGIFAPEMINQAKELEDSQMVARKRNELIPGANANSSVNRAIAMYILLQRESIQRESNPQKDVWDIIASEPGLDNNSQIWNAKLKLTKLNARVTKTREDLDEINKLKKIIGAGSPLDVDADEPSIAINVEDAGQIIDESMERAINAQLENNENLSNGLLAQTRRAFGHETSSMLDNRARNEVYPKRSVAQESTEPLVFTDEGTGKENEKIGKEDNMNHITDDSSPASLYDSRLPSNLLSIINNNTKQILSGGNDKSLLGTFRKDLNDNFFVRPDESRAARAVKLYNLIHETMLTSKYRIAQNEKKLADERFVGKNKNSIKEIESEINSDKNTISMIESYNIFDHLAKMIHYGNEFNNLVEKSYSKNGEALDVDVDNHGALIQISKLYDEEAREIWNFITRTVFKDKKSIARFEAQGFGIKLGKSLAASESKLNEDDRNEIAAIVADKIQEKSRFLENPATRVSTISSSEISNYKQSKTIKNQDGTKIENPYETETEIQNLVNGTISKVSPEQLYRYLSRNGVTYALEMDKLDRISGRNREIADRANSQAGVKSKYKQNFTNSTDFAWYVNDWLEKADISDDMIAEGHDGFSVLDHVIARMEKQYAKPGGIYWNDKNDKSFIFDVANPMALCYSLLAKYAYIVSNENPQLKTNIESLIDAASNKISQEKQNIIEGIGYENLDSDAKSKVDFAISAAINVKSNPGLKSRLIDEYTTKGGKAYDGTNPRAFSIAKTALSMQSLNSEVISELINRNEESNALKIENGKFKFENKQIVSYIAYTISNEIINSIKQVKKPGEWALESLSPMQIELNLKAGQNVSTKEIKKYAGQRLDEYHDTLLSQIENVDNPEEHNNIIGNIGNIIKLAEAKINTLIDSGLGGLNGQITMPLSESIRQMHFDSQPVSLSISENVAKKLNDSNLDLKEIDREHVYPALTNSTPENIQRATAKAMRNATSGEYDWPIAVNGIHTHTKEIREQLEGESDEAYDMYLKTPEVKAVLAKIGKGADSWTGYGPKTIEHIDSSVIRNPEIADNMHIELSQQVQDRINYLKLNHDAKDPQYTSAVQDSNIKHLREIQKDLGAYQQYRRNLGTGAKSSNAIGALYLDPEHPLYQQLSPYQIKGRNKDVSNLEQSTPAKEENPVIANIINKLVKLAIRLDSNNRYSEADYIDSLIRKLEVSNQ